MFDYISTIMIVVLVLGILIGVFRGGFKMISGAIIVAAGIIAGIFLSKLVAGWILNSDMGRGINSWLFNLIADKVNVQVGPAITVTGRDMITESQLAAMNTAGKAFSGDPNFDLLHSAYQSISLPSAFWTTFDELINNAIKAYDGAQFALAQPVADIVTNASCYAIAFAAIFVGVLIIGGIVLLIIRIVLKASGHKPGLLSRLIGGIAGLAIAAVIVWAGCLTLNLLMMMENDVSSHLKAVMRIDDPNAWTFAKWLCQAPLGYNQIISFFIK